MTIYDYTRLFIYNYIRIYLYSCIDILMILYLVKEKKSRKDILLCGQVVERRAFHI